MEKLNPTAVAIAAVVISSVIFAVCALAFTLLPESAAAFLALWFHGFEFPARTVRGHALTLGQLFFGLFCLVGVSFALGLLFAALYNLIPSLRNPGTVHFKKGIS